MAEDGEPEVLVAATAVDAGPVEKCRATDEIDVDVAPRKLAGVNRNADVVGAEFNSNFWNDFREGPPRRVDLRIHRNNDFYRLSALREVTGERRSDVAEPSHFGKRGDLGGDEKDVHRGH